MLYPNSGTGGRMDVYLEIGAKRTFAGAIDWPGWARSGRDESSAQQALLDYGPRYARVLAGEGIDFQPPENAAALVIVERLEGNSTTDFGAPGIAPSSDSRPVDEDQLAQLQALLRACWRTFDQAVSKAAGKELRRGPRGGGRDLEAIAAHVLGADEGYLAALGWKLKNRPIGEPAVGLSRVRQETLEALASSARGEIPAQGPRGGTRWSARYFVRRTAWHVLDHAWEIEDRLMG